MKIFKKQFLTLFMLASAGMAFANQQIVVATDNTSLVFTVGDDGRLYQSYFGEKLLNESDYANLPLGKEAYITHGMEDYFEPALHINHTDGNTSTLLEYKRHETITHDGCKETVIYLSDPVYSSEVALHYAAFGKENVYKAWSEIKNGEKGNIILEKYASCMLNFYQPKYFLTQYDGDWASEVRKSTQELHFGKKVIDTKLGTRANMFTSPFFQLSFNNEATENAGKVLVGTLAWTGNFRFTFEVDNKGYLRIISGINPYASQYAIKKGESFKTPDFIFTLNNKGTGYASRNLHDWARNY